MERPVIDLPGEKDIATTVTNPVESWSLLMTDKILDIC